MGTVPTPTRRPLSRVLEAAFGLVPAALFAGYSAFVLVAAFSQGLLLESPPVALGLALLGLLGLAGCVSLFVAFFSPGRMTAARLRWCRAGLVGGLLASAVFCVLLTALVVTALPVGSASLTELGALGLPLVLALSLSGVAVKVLRRLNALGRRFS